MVWYQFNCSINAAGYGTQTFPYRVNGPGCKYQPAVTARICFRGFYLSLFNSTVIVSKSAGAVLRGMPPNFVFTKLKPVIINNSIGRLIWGVCPEGQPPVVTGMDIARFKKGKIKSLYVFIDN